MSPLSLLDEVSSSCLGCGCWTRCHRRVSAVAAGRGVIVVSRLWLLDEMSSSCLRSRCSMRCHRRVSAVAAG